jgi:hypothetical protein
MISFFFTNTSNIPKNLIQFYDQQNTWTRQQIAKHNSDHWQQIGLITNQFDGLVAGYNLTGDYVKFSIFCDL